jgi:uncharacterized protein (DUF2062 family)
MAKRLFRKYVPSPERVKWLGPLGHRPDLWHLNRHSVSRAFAIGVFWGFIPVPLQTIPTVLSALLFRGNVPLSWGITWIINPFSLFPTAYAAYTIGRLVLRHDPIDFHLTWSWLWQNFWNIGLPLYLGSLILATGGAILSYLTIQIFWRTYVMRRWRKRRQAASDKLLQL